MKLTRERLNEIPYHSGPTNAKIIFVGEAPGASEESHPQKWPFVGKSGFLLRSWLTNVGISPDSVYFTNLLKERPPGNKFDKFVRENPARLVLHAKLLASELELLSPNCNLIVPVGAHALRVICGNGIATVCDERRGMKIMTWRGSIIPATLRTVKGKKCVPIIHPAAIARQYLMRDPTLLDLMRVQKKEDSPTSVSRNEPIMLI